jgi:hypothetical protein
MAMFGLHVGLAQMHTMREETTSDPGQAEVRKVN